MWNNVDDIPPFVPQETHVKTGRTNPAGKPVPTGKPVSASKPVSAGKPVPAGKPNYAGRPFPAGWKRNVARPLFKPTSPYFQNDFGLFIMTQCIWGGGR